MTCKDLIDKLNKEHTLSHSEWTELIADRTEQDIEYAGEVARSIADQRFGKKIYFRGIIEFTNFCKNDCFYCGIRRSNSLVSRYRLDMEDILSSCEAGYLHGFRTFVLQGGEDAYFNDDIMCDIVKKIRERYPDCAITLSLGERSRESYQKLFDAGANRYLLRHESACDTLYAKWHPQELKLKNRLECLKNLREIGYQTGCGFMVGAPWQTAEDLACDMEFISEFKPQMVGIGPFIPHKDTPFGCYAAGEVGLTLFMMSLCRIMLPNVLLPATTALETVRGEGRKLGVLAGCNVVMPNLSPQNVRKKYLLYNDKAGTDDTVESGIRKLREHMSEIGYEVVCGRGDYKETAKE